jgi:hypothetical protein
MVDLVVPYPMSADRKAFFGNGDSNNEGDHSDDNCLRTKRHETPSAKPISSETTVNSSEHVSGVYGGFYGGANHSEYASDGEDSFLSTSTGSYRIGRRRKLNYVAVDNSVDGDGDYRNDHFKREMHRLADSILADSILEEEDEDDGHPSSTAENASSISSSSAAQEETAHPALLVHDALEVCPPNTLRYDMDVEVQRLLHRNKRVLLSKLVECGARRNLTMVRQLYRRPACIHSFIHRLRNVVCFFSSFVCAWFVSRSIYPGEAYRLMKPCS